MADFLGGGTKVRRRRLSRAGSAAAMVAVAIVATGCSLVQMPSNKALAGPAQTTSIPSPSASHSHAASTPNGPAVEAMRAERLTSAADSFSATIYQQIGGSQPVTVSGYVIAQRSPLLASEQLQISADGQTLPITAVITAETIYIKAAGLVPSSPEPWIGVPLTDIAGLGTGLQSAENVNPVTQTRMFLASTHVTVVGHQVVDGVLTTGYSGSFTPAQALSAAVTMSPSSLQPLLTQAASLLTGDVNFTIWVGPGPLIRKYYATENVSGLPISTTCTINWFNEPVNVAVPPASEVVGPPSGGVIEPLS